MNKLKFLFLSLLFFISSCAEAPSSSSAMNSAPSYQTAAKESSRGGATTDEAVPGVKQISLEQNDQGREQPANAPVERKIIRNAELSLEAASPEDAQQKITAIAEIQNPEARLCPAEGGPWGRLENNHLVTFRNDNCIFCHK